MKAAVDAAAFPHRRTQTAARSLGPQPSTAGNIPLCWSHSDSHRTNSVPQRGEWRTRPPVRPRSTMRSCSGPSIAAGSEPPLAGTPASRFRCWYGTRPVHAAASPGGHRAPGTPWLETYQATRSPCDLRLAPMDAAQLTERLRHRCCWSSRTEHLPRVLAQFEITGGGL